MATVLIVDDDPVTLQLVSTSLEKAGHETVTTDDPTMAVQLTQVHEVDVVVLDILMPVRSGYEVLSDLRKTTAGASLPVLMLSALSGGGDRVMGLKQGADDYLPKPYETEELVLRVERLSSIARRSSAILSGNLEHYSLIELLHSLQQPKKSGVLRLESGARGGIIELREGQVTMARSCALFGQEALHELLDERQGHFRFDPKSDTDETPVMEPMPVESELIHAAWVEDELGKRPAISDTVGWCARADVEIKDDIVGKNGLPMEVVLSAVRGRPGITTSELVAHGVAATKRTRLTLHRLSELKLVEPILAYLEEDPQDSGEKIDESLNAAVWALIRAAIARGHSAALVHLLIAWSSEHSTATAIRLIQSLADDTRLSPRVPATASLISKGGGCSLHLRCDLGNLLVHFHPLNQETYRLRARALAPDCVCAIAILNEETELDDFRWLLGATEGLKRPIPGILVVPDQQSAKRIQKNLDSATGWQVGIGQPKSLADLLSRSGSVLLGKK